MAKTFNLTAQLNLQGPGNLKPVIGRLKKELSTISNGINLKIDSKSVSSIRNASTEMKALSSSLTKAAKDSGVLNKNLASLNSTINKTQQSTAKTAAATATAAQGLNKVSSAAAKANTGLQKIKEFFTGPAVTKSLAFSTVYRLINLLGSSLDSTATSIVKFEKELNRLKQVDPTGNIQAVSKEIRNLSVSLGVSSSELSKATVTLAQAGIKAAEAASYLKTLAQTDLSATFNSLEQTTEGLIAIKNQFQLTGKSVTDALDSINAVSKRFAIESADLIGAVQRTGGVFAAATGDEKPGIKALQQFAAVVTAVRSTTRESAETIATGIKTITARLQRVSTASSVFKELGVNIRDVNGEFIGTYESLELISKAIADQGITTGSKQFARLVEQIGGVRQIGKIIPLLTNFKQAQEALKVAQEGSGSIAKDAATAQETLANSLVRVQEAFFDLGDAVASSGLGLFAKILLDSTTAALKLAKAFAPLLPLFAIKSTGLFGKGGIGKLDIFGNLKSVFSGGGGNEKGNTANTSATQNNTSAVNKQTESINNLITVMQAFEAKAFDEGVPQFNKGGKVMAFARGGVVPGSGNRDTVPAMLQPGEFVIRKNAVNSIGTDNLHQMNRRAGGGFIQRFSDGGGVTAQTREALEKLPNLTLYKLVQMSNGDNIGKAAQEILSGRPKEDIFSNRYSAGGSILREKAVGAAILKGREDTTKTPISRDLVIAQAEGKETDKNTDKGILSANIPAGKNWDLVRDTVDRSVRTDFLKSIRSGLVKGLNHSAKGLGTKYGLPSVAVPRSEVQNFMAGLNDAAVGNLFEGIMSAMANQGVWDANADPQANFDFVGPFSGGLSGIFPDIAPLEYKDAKASQKAATRTNFANKIANQALEQITGTKLRGTEGAIIGSLANASKSSPMSLAQIRTATGKTNLKRWELENLVDEGKIRSVETKIEKQKTLGFYVTQRKAMGGFIQKFMEGGDVASQKQIAFIQSLLSQYQEATGSAHPNSDFYGDPELEKRSASGAINTLKKHIGQASLIRQYSGDPGFRFNGGYGEFMVSKREQIGKPQQRKLEEFGGDTAKIEEYFKSGERGFSGSLVSGPRTPGPNSATMRTRTRYGYGGRRRYAAGGAAGSDTVPALLTPGEFVINKKAASQIGSSNLHRLNRADKVQGFNTGGPVGFVQKFGIGGGVGSGSMQIDLKKAMAKAIEPFITFASKIKASTNGIVAKLKTFNGALGIASISLGSLLYFEDSMNTLIGSSKELAAGFGAVKGALEGFVQAAGTSKALGFDDQTTKIIAAGVAIGKAITKAYEAYVQKALDESSKKIGKSADDFDKALQRLSDSLNQNDIGAYNDALAYGAQSIIEQRALLDDRIGTSRIGGGDLAVGAVGGALSGAAIGAAIGTAIAPGVGTAIGAAIGAIGGGIAGYGVVRANMDAQVKAAEMYVNASEKTLEGFKQLAGFKLDRLSLQELQDLNKQQAYGATLTNTYAEALVKTGRYTQEAADAEADEASALASYAQKRKAEGATEEQITSELSEKRQQSIEIGRRLRDEMAKQLLLQKIHERQLKAVQVATKALIDTLGDLGQQLQRSTDEANEADRAFALDRQSRLGERGVMTFSDQNSNVLNNPGGYSFSQVNRAALNAATPVVGRQQAEELAVFARSAKVIETALPKLLQQSDQSPEGRAGVADVVEQMLQAQGLDPNEIDSVMKQIREVIEKNNEADIGTLIEELGPVIDNISAAGQEGMKQLQAAQQRMTLELNRSASAFQSMYEAMSRARAFDMKAAEIGYQAQLDLRKAVGDAISLDELNAGFDNRINSMLDPMRARGVAVDPNVESIVRGMDQLRLAQAGITQNISQLQAGYADIGMGPNAQAAVDAQTAAIFSNMDAWAANSDALAESRYALELLANDGSKAANALGKIQEQQQRLGASANYLRDVFTSDPIQNLQRLQGLQALRGAQTGDRAVLQNPQLLGRAFEAFDSISAMLSQEQRNQMEGQLYRNLFDAQGLRPDQEFMPGMTYQDIVDSIEGRVDPTDRLVQAYKDATNEQIKANKKLGDMEIAEAKAQKERLFDIYVAITELPERLAMQMQQANRFASGGMVYASQGQFIPKGTDTVPAMLTPGEYVMNKKAVQKHGVGMMNYLNAGGEPEPQLVSGTVDPEGALLSLVKKSYAGYAGFFGRDPLDIEDDLAFADSAASLVGMIGLIKGGLKMNSTGSAVPTRGQIKAIRNAGPKLKNSNLMEGFDDAKDGLSHLDGNFMNVNVQEMLAETERRQQAVASGKERMQEEASRGTSDAARNMLNSRKDLATQFYAHGGLVNYLADGGEAERKKARDEAEAVRFFAGVLKKQERLYNSVQESGGYDNPIYNEDGTIPLGDFNQYFAQRFGIPTDGAEFHPKYKQYRAAYDADVTKAKEAKAEQEKLEKQKERDVTMAQQQAESDRMGSLGALGAAGARKTYSGGQALTTDQVLSDASSQSQVYNFTSKNGKYSKSGKIVGSYGDGTYKMAVYKDGQPFLDKDGNQVYSSVNPELLNQQSIESIRSTVNNAHGAAAINAEKQRQEQQDAIKQRTEQKLQQSEAESAARLAESRAARELKFRDKAAAKASRDASFADAASVTEAELNRLIAVEKSYIDEMAASDKDNKGQGTFASFFGGGMNDNETKVARQKISNYENGLIELAKARRNHSSNLYDQAQEHFDFARGMARQPKIDVRNFDVKKDESNYVGGRVDKGGTDRLASEEFIIGKQQDAVEAAITVADLTIGLGVSSLAKAGVKEAAKYRAKQAAMATSKRLAKEAGEDAAGFLAVQDARLLAKQSSKEAAKRATMEAQDKIVAKAIEQANKQKGYVKPTFPTTSTPNQLAGNTGSSALSQAIKEADEFSSAVTSGEMFGKGTMLPTDKYFSTFKELGSSAMSGLASLFKSKTTQTAGAAGAASYAASKFSRGGTVYASNGMFTPKGTDTVPAMLTPGEFVINRDSTNKYRGLIEKINSDTLYAANGAIVGGSTGGGGGGGGGGGMTTIDFSEFNKNVNLFDGSVNSFGGFVTSFGSYVTALQNFQFPTLPDRIELFTNGRIVHEVRGAAAFEALEVRLNESVEAQGQAILNLIYNQSNGTLGSSNGGQ